MRGRASMAAKMRSAAAMPADAVGQSWERLRKGCCASSRAVRKPAKALRVIWPCRFCQPATNSTKPTATPRNRSVTGAAAARRRTAFSRVFRRVLQPGIDPRDAVGFQAIGLDDAPAVHRFGQHHRQVAGLAHAAGGGAAHRTAQPLHRPGHARQDDQRQHAQLPVADQHIGEIDHQLHRFQEDGGDALGQPVAHQGGVIEEVGDELAGMHGIEVGQVAADQAGEHVALGRRPRSSRPANPASCGRRTG